MQACCKWNSVVDFRQRLVLFISFVWNVEWFRMIKYVYLGHTMRTNLHMTIVNPQRFQTKTKNNIYFNFNWMLHQSFPQWFGYLRTMVAPVQLAALSEWIHLLIYPIYFTYRLSLSPTRKQWAIIVFMNHDAIEFLLINQMKMNCSWQYLAFCIELN